MYVGLLGVAVTLIGSYVLGFFGPASAKGRADSGSTTQFVGNKTYYPSFGVYPKDCRWRPVEEKGKSSFEYVW